MDAPLDETVYTYRVKVLYLNNPNRTNSENDYNSIYDAIKVIKDLNIGSDRTYISAFSDTVFNKLFPVLLRDGFVFTGEKTRINSHGNVMVFLLKVHPDTQTESPILPRGAEAIATPFTASISTVPMVGEPDTRIMHIESITENYIAMNFINPERIHRTEPGAGNYS